MNPEKNNELPDVQKCKYQAKYLSKVEFEIARKNNKINLYLEKWAPLNDV